ncbi:MAG: hypothetical protein K0R10_2123 [Alphaproteobacteria bacterium]|nr:hypothetical protein [Alphaproteobacteria bacterium]
MDLIRLNVFPPRRGTEILPQLIIATARTRIVKSTATSPWEVFLRPEHAEKFSIHYRPQKKKTSKKNTEPQGRK